MKLRIGWLSPFSPYTGIGGYTRSLERYFNNSNNEQGNVEFEFTLLVPPSERLYPLNVNAIRLCSGPEAVDVLDLFDLLVFHIGNNDEHHEVIHRLLQQRTGIVVCHDYVYQHYFARKTFEHLKSRQSYGALVAQYYETSGLDVLEESGAASTGLPILYPPWETSWVAAQPLSDPLIHLASALVVHSRFAENYVNRRFEGPILRLGMPCDQKEGFEEDDRQAWREEVASSPYVRALTFGHLTPNKCIDAFLRAIARSKLLRSTIRYTISGRPGDRDLMERLRGLIEEHELGENVKFELDVSEARLTELMRKADFFVNLRHPNSEGASASLAEQLRAGKPSLVYNSGCYAEVPKDAAICVDVNDVEGIVTAIEGIVRNRTLLIAKGDAARALSSRLNSQEYVERLKAFILDNLEQLKLRHRIGKKRYAPETCCETSDEYWFRRLGFARETLQLLHDKWLPVAALSQLSGRDAARYFVLVLMGLSPSEELLSFLEVHLTTLTPVRLYRLASLAYVISGSLADAACENRSRLAELAPIFDLDLWRLLERLPRRALSDWTRLALWNRSATPEEQKADSEEARLFGDRRSLFNSLVSQRLETPDFELDPNLDPLLQWLGSTDWLGAFDNYADAPVLPVDEWLATTEGSDNALPKFERFYRREACGIWSRGAAARLSFRLKDVTVPVREVRLRLWGTAADPTESRNVVIGDIFSGKESCVSLPANKDVFELRLALDPAQKHNFYAIKLVVDQTFNPAKCGLSDDGRDLGVCLVELRIATSAESSSEPYPVLGGLSGEELGSKIRVDAGCEAHSAQ